MLDIFSWKFVAGAILALSPVLSYGDTVWSIHRTRQCVGFSLDLTAIMLISSILRVFFYFGEPYEASLLIQSVLMIGVQVILLHLALKYRVVNVGISASAPPTGNVPESEKKEERQSRARSSSASIGMYIPDDINKDSSLLNKSVDDISVSRRKSLTEGNTSRSSAGVNQLLPVSETGSDSLWKQNRAYLSRSSQKTTVEKLWQSIDMYILDPLRDLYGDNGQTQSQRNTRMFESYSHGRPLGFWQWIDPLAYWVFLFEFTSVLTVLHFLVGNHSVYFETIGFLGLLLEAVLPLPQLITNHQRHSVQGFRLSLLANWLGGDASKMFYYAYGTTNSNQLAPQFIMCVLVQTLLDICAGFQYYYYSYIYNGSSSGAGSSRPRGSSFQLPIFSVGSKVPSSVLSPSADQGRKGGGSRDSIELDIAPFPTYIPTPAGS